MTKTRLWIIVGLLFVGMVIAYIDRTNLSIALAAPEFKQFFQLTDGERGWLNSAFFWSYAFLQIPAGYVTDRYGVRWPYALSFAAWSGIAAAAALAGSFWQLFALRVLLGVGEAVVTPASMRWIRLHIAERQRGLAIGIFFAGAKVGPAIGAALAVPLLGWLGWRGMFVVLGLSGLLWLVPWLLLVKEDDLPIKHHAQVQEAAANVSFGQIWKTPLIYGVLIGTIAYNYFNYFCLTWLPAYFVERWKLSLGEMGFYTTFSFLGMAIVAIAGGALADLLIARGADAVRVRKGFTVAGLLIAATEIIGALSQSREVAIAFAVISLSGLGLTTANYWALTQTLMPGAAIGRVAGTQNFAANLAGIAAPLVTGWLIERTGNFQAPMVAILIVLACGVAAYLLLVRREYAPVKSGATR